MTNKSRPTVTAIHMTVELILAMNGKSFSSNMASSKSLGRLRLQAKARSWLQSRYQISHITS
jgi:hypothetical protein